MCVFVLLTVGAGTSGGVIASRLAEDKDLNVLLIEAGGDPSENADVDIPIFTDKVRGSEFDWGFTTVPQRHACKSHIDQVWTIFTPRHCFVFFSSSIYRF